MTYGSDTNVGEQREIKPAIEIRGFESVARALFTLIRRYSTENLDYISSTGKSAASYASHKRGYILHTSLVFLEGKGVHISTSFRPFSGRFLLISGNWRTHLNSKRIRLPDPQANKPALCIPAGALLQGAFEGGVGLVSVLGRPHFLEGSRVRQQDAHKDGPYLSLRRQEQSQMDSYIIH
jgi:hypothetical protein